MDLRTLPLADLAQVIRRRREAAGMSQPQLARRAGLTLTTIKNLEKGRHRPARDTLGRLLALPELGLISLDLLSAGTQTERPNSWLLPHYSRKKLLDEMIEIVNSPGGALQQTCMYLDDQSAGGWMSLCGSSAYQEAYRARAMPVGKFAEKIATHIGGRGLDVIALGCGDGRSEVRLVEALSAQRGWTDLRLHLLDISHTLMTVANEHATERLAGMGVEVNTLHGDFHHLARYGMLLPQSETTNRRRLYAMLGSTVANLNNEVVFFRDALSLAAPGDLCLLDF